MVVTGAATGMGAETVALLDTLGAAIHAVDIVDVAGPVASAHRVDIGDPASIDVALADLPDRIHALVNCAGIPGGTRFDARTVMRVNFLGLATSPRPSSTASPPVARSPASPRWPAAGGPTTWPNYPN